jgi:hypothetical protein
MKVFKFNYGEHVGCVCTPNYGARKVRIVGGDELPLYEIYRGEDPIGYVQGSPQVSWSESEDDFLTRIRQKDIPEGATGVTIEELSDVGN